MSSFSILPEWSHTDQRRNIKSYIKANLVKRGPTDSPFSILPITAIKELATYSNISLVIAKDPGLSDLNERGRDNYAKNIHKYCPRLFVACMYAETNMPLLCNMWNVSIGDNNLPLGDQERIKPEHAEEFGKFLDIQYVFCAPVFTLGVFDQAVAQVRMIPWRQVVEGGDKGLHVMRFHPDHLVEHKEDEPGSYTGNLDFHCWSYGSKKLAEKDEKIWSKAKLAFMCHKFYYVLFEPDNVATA